MVSLSFSNVAPAELTTNSEGTGPVGVTRPMLFWRGTFDLASDSCANASKAAEQRPPAMSARHTKFLASMVWLLSCRRFIVRAAEFFCDTAGTNAACRLWVSVGRAFLEDPL